MTERRVCWIVGYCWILRKDVGTTIGMLLSADSCVVHCSEGLVLVLL